jgi:DNA-binding response OmpR family regulator
MSTADDGGLPCASPIAPNKATNRRVLVVDDNRDLAVGSSAILRAQGHEVKVAFDGLMALEVARTFRPDVVLLDVNLPRIGGYELARRLRAEYGFEVSLIIITADDRDYADREGCEMCVDHRFTKPVDFNTLINLLAADDFTDRERRISSSTAELLTRAERCMAASVKLCQRSAETLELSRNSMRLMQEAISALRATSLPDRSASG